MRADKRMPAWLIAAISVAGSLLLVWLLFGKDLMAARAIREGVEERVEAERRRSELRNGPGPIPEEGRQASPGMWINERSGWRQSEKPSELELKSGNWKYEKN